MPVEKKYCSRSCRNLRIALSCKVCGERFEVERHRKNAKYCSPECHWADLKGKHFSPKNEFRNGNIPWNSGKTKETDIKVLRIALSKKGKKRPRHVMEKLIASNKGRKLSEKHRRKISKGIMGHKVSETTRRKLSVQKLGAKNPMFGKRCPEKAIKHSRRWMQSKRRDPVFIKKMFKALNRRPTKPEKRMDGILQKHFAGEWKYVGDGKVIIMGLCPDFINCNGKKKIIEVFGDVFHNPDKAFGSVPWHQQPQGRREVFAQMGYEMLIIWESELNTLPEKEIVERITDFVGKL